MKSLEIWSFQSPPGGEAIGPGRCFSLQYRRPHPAQADLHPQEQKQVRHWVLRSYFESYFEIEPDLDPLKCLLSVLFCLKSFRLYSLMAQDDSTCKNVFWKCDGLSVDSLTNCKSSSLIVKDFWIIVKDFSDVNPITLWFLWSQQFILIYFFQVFPIECPRCQIERFKYKLRA